MNDVAEFLGPIRRLHQKIRDEVVATCERATLEELSGIAKDEEGDTIYAIDRVSEELLVEFFEKNVAPRCPILLVAEGLDGGEVRLPRDCSIDDVKWRIIVDPIDGTRGIMYQKRSAWILTGVAPNNGPETGLQDISLAVQTEIPLVKQHLSDTLWAIKGQGAYGERFNRITGERSELVLRPSRARSIEHGFATIARFFPGAREGLAALDEELIRRVLGPVQKGKAHCFEDQYISTAGQLYELMAGHDRFIADIRPLMEQVMAGSNLALGLCCHPYDLCTELIARELGVIVVDADGQLVNAPLKVAPDLSWIGYANADIRDQIQPALMKVLKEQGLRI